MKVDYFMDVRNPPREIPIADVLLDFGQQLVARYGLDICVRYSYDIDSDVVAAVFPRFSMDFRENVIFHLEPGSKNGDHHLVTCDPMRRMRYVDVPLPKAMQLAVRDNFQQLEKICERASAHRSDVVTLHFARYDDNIDEHDMCLNVSHEEWVHACEIGAGKAVHVHVPARIEALQDFKEVRAAGWRFHIDGLCDDQGGTVVRLLPIRKPNRVIATVCAGAHMPVF